jgi:hypothetical protein
MNLNKEPSNTHSSKNILSIADLSIKIPVSTNHMINYLSLNNKEAKDSKRAKNARSVHRKNKQQEVQSKISHVDYGAQLNKNGHIETLSNSV